MDKTKMKLAAFFDQDEDESSPVPKSLDGQKLNHYAQGTVRKSKREREKEAAEARQREEEENAAKAYAEFVDAFDGGESSKKKAGSAFVKSSADSGAAYTPSARVELSSRPAKSFERQDRDPSPPSAPRPKGKRAMDAFLEEIKKDQAEREARFSRSGQGRSVTALAAYEGQSGSKDRGDPETSNLFVANLPAHVTESSFGNFFARIGPVGSVKIMWPRTDATVGPGADMTATRRSKNAGMSGFVSFMKRKDAEAALRELDGFNWGGSILRVGWSKAVPIAAKALYTAKKSQSRSRSGERDSGRKPGSRSPEPSHRREKSRSRSPARDRDRHHERPSHRSRSRSPRRSRSFSPSHRRKRSRSRSGSPGYGRSSQRARGYERSRSGSPPRHRQHQQHSEARHRDGEDGGDDVADEFIRTVATQVKGHDALYEQSLREREKTNPQYSFLTDRHHRKHGFYRTLVQKRDNGQPEFDDEGYNSVYSTDSAEDSEREHGRRNHLGRLARKRFQAMLRALSGRRGELARCMAFSLEHGEAAAEVADIIVASLVVDGTPVPRKVSRLHLICDILHNSAVSLPGAWKFRQEFQARLGLVFDHFSTIYHSFPGRITADVFKKQITSVVDIWEDWIVFPPDFTAELRARLEGSKVPEQQTEEAEDTTAITESAPAFVSRFKASSFKPADEPTPETGPGALAPNISPDTGIDGEAMDEGSDDLDGEPVDDLDGEPVDDLDGEPISEDVDGVPDEDIDGAPVDDEDLDGEPMDEDLDGTPVAV